MLRRIVSGSVILAITIAAYHYLSSKGSNGEMEDLEKELVQKEEDNLRSSLPHSLAVVVEVATQKTESQKDHFTGLASVESALAKIPLTESEGKLLGLVGNSEEGRAFRQIYLSSEYGRSIPGSDLHSGQLTRILLQTDVKGKIPLERIFDDLSSEDYSLEKTRILSFLDSHEGTRPIVNALAKKEIEREQNPTQSNETIETDSLPLSEFDSERDLNVTRHSDTFQSNVTRNSVQIFSDVSPRVKFHKILLNSSTNESEAYTLTLESILANKNPLLQAAMSVQLISTYPEAKSKLAATLTQNGIDFDLDSLLSSFEPEVPERDVK